MAEITKKRKGELVRAVFQVLLAEPEGLPAQEVLRRVEALRPPSEFELQDYPNRPGVRRYEKVIRFSTITSTKAGWLIKANARWSLSPEGRDAFSKYQDPERFLDEAWKIYEAWRRSRPEITEDGGEAAEDEETSSTLEEASENARTAIREYIAKMPPYEFQKLVAALLKGMGYHVSYVAPPGPDRGVDIIAYRDPLGAESPRIKVQVKRQGSAVAADSYRSFLSTIGEGDLGIFVATGGFTSDAHSEARHERRRTTLIDMEALINLWTENYGRVSESEKALLPLTPVYFLSPSD
jgi:restriction system protein